jgi:VIT1/CCC1 family predicted Fe2+/Mn2+ transporter
MSHAHPADGEVASGDAGAESTREAAAEHIDVTRLRVARRSRIREVIFGTQDGLLTTLGLVSGVGAATSDRYTVLVAGVAGSVAGLIAMGAGAYISSKSQLEVARAEVARERLELAANPERELEELVQLFEQEGLPEEDARVVAEKIAQRPMAMLNAMTQKELGLVLDSTAPLREGAVMALAFLVGALVPIVPWFVAGVTGGSRVAGFDLSPALMTSVLVTALTLFALGVGKARVAHSSMLKGGVEIMGIGILAAVFGFLLGSLFPHLVGAKAGA